MVVEIQIDTRGQPAFIVFILAEGDALPRLSIPERYRVGVAGLAALSEDAFADFLAAVQTGLSADTASDLAAQMEKGIESLRQHADLSNIIAAVASMQSIYCGSHVSSKTFGRDVVDALSADAPSLAKKVALKVLAERAIKIAEAQQIELTDQKIRDIQTEVERGYCCGRILTDLRPAFADDPTKPPKAMTILHTLRIGYINDTGEHREFYITLDKSDLSDLKELIERALTKSKTLEALIAKAECRLCE